MISGAALYLHLQLTPVAHPVPVVGELPQNLTQSKHSPQVLPSVQTSVLDLPSMQLQLTPALHTASSTRSAEPHSSAQPSFLHSAALIKVKDKRIRNKAI